MKHQYFNTSKHLIFLSFTLLFVFSCTEKRTKNITSNFYSFNKKVFHFGDTLRINTDSKLTIDSVVLKIGNNRISNSQNIILDSSIFRYGKNKMAQQVYFTKNNKKRNIKYKGVFSIHPSLAEKNIGYEVLNEYNHQVANFTQGLVINDDGYIIESTGEYGSSELLKYILGSDSYSEQIRLSGKYFGEGATILNGKIYQLTWQNRKGFIYDEKSFEKIDEFNYPDQIRQGWGLTTNGKDLILSDGSSYLYFLDDDNPSKIIRKVEVLGHKNIYRYLNELEYANNYIYANILDSDIILKINPQNGVVVGSINLKEIAAPFKKYGVLNGIAYNPTNNSFIITGKNWPKMYEIKLLE